ncbi:MAG TPA: sulfatase-like hydrolase/transferase [Bacillota bacterium]|nr:sulfatase-like hydrolase/transferase [Bacillota bacterium]
MNRPNVLVFMTDQQRGVTVDPDHRLKAVTPHLDRFAQRATSFTRAHTVAPHCCPSRTSFFTGRYPSEHGVWNNVNVPNALSRGPRDGTHFWSEDFADAGYRLGFSGKWHVSNSAGPATYGWDELVLTAGPRGTGTLDEQYVAARDQQLAGLRRADPSDIDGKRGPGEVLRPGWPAFRLYGTDEDPFGDREVVDHAVARTHDSGRTDGDDPWMLYVGTLGPHDPYVPPQRFLDLYDPESLELPASFADPMTDKPALYRRTRDRFDQLTEDEHRAALHHYLAFCSYQDELFGRLLTALEETGQAEDTIVVYLSDHGDYTGEHGLWTKGLPSFTPAYHVPLLMHVPGTTDRPRTTDAPVSLVDLGPTLAELCNVAAPPMSGRSLVADLTGDGPDDPRDLVFQSNGNEVYGIQRTLLTDRWKLVVNLFDEDELYDLATDPDEMVNLIARESGPRTVGREPLATVPAEHREVLTALYRRLWRFSLDHADEVLNPYIFTALATVGPLDAVAEVNAADR